MRKILTICFVLVLLALNWAALHDILKGEPDVWMEWSFVIGSVLLLCAYLVQKSVNLPEAFQPVLRKAWRKHPAHEGHPGARM